MDIGDPRKDVPENLVDLRLWGKERGLGGVRYPLVCHCLDTAAAALVLWREYLSPGTRAFLAESMGTDEEHAGHIVAFWAGLHDLGKLTHPFQRQVDGVDLTEYPREDDGGEPRPHATVTGHWLGLALSRLGYPNGAFAFTPLVAQLLSGHHGRFAEHAAYNSDDPLGSVGFTRGPWEAQRLALLDGVFETLGRPDPPDALSSPAAAIACGLVILADWLVSQEGFIRPRLAHLPKDGSVPLLRAHFAESLRRIPGVLDDAGLRPINVAPKPFAEAFPRIAAPNGLQRSLAAHLPGLCDDGGLVLITAPMGEGKTEAAYFAADLLGAATGRPGRYLALPTMATADQMYRRFKEYAVARAEPSDAAGPSTLALLHAMAWLNPDYVPDDDIKVSEVLSGTPGGRGADRYAATEWLLGAKRGLLASWSVGTIDQALMAVLPARHNVVRMFGLAQKVVVIDEVHAVDPYMQILLEQALRWLGTLRTPVVLLSATLHHSMADSLVKAYLEGSTGRRRRKGAPKAVDRLTYPGWLHAHPSGRVTRSHEIDPLPIPSTPRTPLDIDVARVPVRNGAADRTAALKSRLLPLVREGGCAAVICTTVADAQATYRVLAAWFAGLGADAPELKLLHARFPNSQRTATTEEAIARFGREGAAAGQRPGQPGGPHASVLVATQVIEQSLDLDLDLIITDLAPVSLLLQRAGRCWRHEHTGIIERPSWADRPRVTVLVPEAGADGDEGDERKGFPRSWCAVYPLSLLIRTRELLRRRAGTPVRVPEDVQALVDGVYDDETLIADVQADVERMGQDMALRTIAKNIVVPSPGGLGDDLARLTKYDADAGEHMLATRFGAGSVRVLCCYEDDAGRRWLDPLFREALPDPGDGEGLTRRQVRDLMARTIPVRADSWYGRGVPEDNRPPDSWEASAHLRGLVLLPQRVEDDGVVAPAELGGRQWLLDPELGLVH